MENIARSLLNIKAVQINSKQKFTWSSGIKSPIYIDNRLITSFPKVFMQTSQSLAENIKKHFQDANVVIGVATSGISHATYAASILKLPMGYVRSSKKNYGKNKQIEGIDVAYKKVVVVEDLLSTGGSALNVVKALSDAKAKVLGVVAIFDYGLAQLQENFKKIKYVTLTNLDELLRMAQSDQLISYKEKQEIEEFRNKL